MSDEFDGVVDEDVFDDAEGDSGENLDDDNKDEEMVEEDVEDKPKRKSVKEEKIITSDYVERDLSEEEAVAAKSLQDSFSSFLTKTEKIMPSEDNMTTIPTGIDVLDAILGGGVATKLVQFVGVPGSGKSALAAQVMATGQKKWPGKFLSVYIDTESSVTTNRLAQLGVRNPPIKPYDDNVTVETIFKIVEKMCVYKEGELDKNPDILDVPYLIVWDSVANTMTEKGMDAEEYKNVVGQRAAILTHYLPKYVGKLDKYNICLLAVNQLRDKIQMGVTKEYPNMKFLPDKNVPGGYSLLYNSFQLFTLRQFGKVLTADDYGFEGVRVHARGVKNKLFTPNIGVDVVFNYDKGFSNFWTNYELLKTFKRITVGGGWVKLQSYPKEKRFRQKQVLEVYKEDEEFRECWNHEVKKLIKVEYIEKYKPEVVV